MLRTIKIGLFAIAASTASLYAPAAFATNTTMLLARATLSSDPDPDNGGTWQYEGGAVENAAGTATIGHYIVTRRVTTSGTSTDNTAAMTITLFFSSSTSGNVPDSITLEGAWSYTSGQFAGSVSAVSSRYRPLLTDDATALSQSGGITKLVIDYTGTDKVP